MKIIYQTERLIVRQWQMNDYHDYFEFVSNPAVSKYLTFQPYKTYKQAKERIANMIAVYQKEPVKADFAILLKTENKVIGSIAISSFKPSVGGVVRIGYMLNPKYQGKGYMTEAVVGLFKYIKKNNIAKRIEATHDVENVKSGNVMKRAGMTFEGIERKAGQNNLHSRYDVALYSILFEEIKD